MAIINGYLHQYIMNMSMYNDKWILRIETITYIRQTMNYCDVSKSLPIYDKL
jgi:hypothetical protein